MKKTLNVLYQSDDNYAMVSGISIVSLLENNKHLDAINVYYCAYNITNQNKKHLANVCKSYQNTRLIFVDATDYHDQLVKLGVKAWHGVYITWLKLLAFADLDLSTDRVVFINGHTIINGQLDYLIEYNFEKNIMALSYDCLVNEHKKTIGLSPTSAYYNCGIMLINHKLWIEQSVSEKIKTHLQKKSDYVIADQDLCNVMFEGKIGTLDCDYNYSSAYYAYGVERLLKVNNLQPEYFYTYDQLMEAYYAPKIIHSLFGIKGKPWEVGNDHPQRQLWEKYLRMTPWKNVQRKCAKRTLLWTLYDIVPRRIFVLLYGIRIRHKYGR